MAPREVAEQQLLVAGGSRDDALEAAENAWELLKESEDDPIAEADAAHLVARLRLAGSELSDAAGAAEAALESRAAYARAACRRGEAEALVTAAHALVLQSHHEAAAGTAQPDTYGAPNFRAVRAAKEAQDLAVNLDDPGLHGVACFAAARAHALNSKAEQAIWSAETAAALFNACGDATSRALALFFLAQVHLELGGKRAKEQAQEAVDRAMTALRPCAHEPHDFATRATLEAVTATLQGGQPPLLAGSLYGDAGALMTAKHIGSGVPAITSVTYREANVLRFATDAEEGSVAHNGGPLSAFLPLEAAGAEDDGGQRGEAAPGAASFDAEAAERRAKEEAEREAKQAAEAAALKAEQERLAKLREEELAKRTAVAVELAREFRKGARVRLNAQGCDAPANYDWSRDAMRPGDVGEVLSCRVVAGVAEVFLKGPHGRTDTYSALDLEKLT